MNRIILLFALLIATTSYAQRGTNSIDQKLVDSVLASYCSADQPGMTIGIVQNGKAIYKNAKGLADLSNSIEITDATAFNIASVSKQFTAMLALMAEQEGELTLEDNISTYLPELSHLPYKIKVKQLANHTHGLPNYSELMAMVGFDLASPITNDQAVQTMLNLKQANFEAGEQFQYGNTGFMLLAEILKRVYDKPFKVLAQEKLFDPLQMNETVVIDDPNIVIRNKALAYRQDGDTYVEAPNRQMENGSSNIHTSITDLLKWAANFQQPNADTKKLYAKMMESTILNDGSKEAYGLGLYTGEYKGLKTVFHGGGTGGYRAYILHVPEHDFSIVTLGNQESFDGLLIIHDLLELYFKDLLVEPTALKKSYTAEELKAFEGVYKFQPGQYWTIKADENNLYFQGDSRPLPSIGDGKFEFIYRPTSYLIFQDNTMDFRIADMRYSCQKMELNPPVLNEKDLEKFVGVYQNMELNTFYQMLIIKGNLVAKHLTNGEIPLQALTENIFYSGYPLGELNFQLNAKKEVTGFVLAGQNFENIKFMKLK